MDAALVSRLCESSVRKSFVPERDIDWSQPFDRDAMPVPEELLSLYGCERYQQLTPGERRLLARHEVSALFAFAIRLENVLIRRFSECAWRDDPLSPWLPYYMHEMEEECRHNRMFIRAIAALGVPAYTRQGLFGVLERFTASFTRRRSFLLLLTLASEEIPDYMFARVAACETAQPALRRVAQIHRIEEARHIRFGRDHFQDLYAQAGGLERWVIRYVAPIAVRGLFDGLVRPEVYVRSGVARSWVEAWQLVFQVRSSPHRQTVRHAAARHLMTYLEEVGVIDAQSRWAWALTDLFPSPAR